MTTRSKTVTGLALAAGAAAVLVTALPGVATAWTQGRAGAGFAQIDTDQDGVLSLEEFTARAKARFAALDSDGDGALSRDEAAQMAPQSRRWGGSRGGYGQAQGGPGYGMFGGMQGTGPMGYGGFGDPSLSEDERAARAAQMIALLDSDDDGLLSAAEMAARPGPEMIFNRVDADADGTISRQEFDAAVQAFGPGAGRKGPNR